MHLTAFSRDQQFARKSLRGSEGVEEGYRKPLIEHHRTFELVYRQSPSNSDWQVMLIIDVAVIWDGV